MESVEAKDGFSFRPQREKKQTALHPILSPPRRQQQKQPPPRQYGKRRTQHLRPNPGAETSKYPLLEYTDFVQVQMEAEDHFNKRFTFTPSPAWKLPAPHTLFTAPIWQREELQEMKASLNTVKQQLSTKDVAVWHTHTTNTNPSQRVLHALKRRVQPEMPTQAWLKFYEIANGYPIVPSKEEDEEEEEDGSGGGGGVKGRLNPTIDEEVGAAFNSVHLCEAPGAFICALNHYLALNQPAVKWQWLGNTLNPYYEGTPPAQCVTYDRLIYHTMENWCFGTDNTGDLTKRNNLQNLLQRAEQLGSVKLVTADGSFDCQADPAEQETMTHPLHMCETVAALSILAAGGSLVIKKFTMFESETVCLMYLLCCVFECVHVYKPGTSKQGNSEVYVIALKYVGRERIKEHLAKVIDASLGDGPPTKAMFREEDIPKDFIQQVKECSSRFMAYQVTSIERNLELFRAMPEREKQLNELLKAKATTLFFERNYCVPIPNWRTLTHGLANQFRQLLETDWNKVSSSLLMRSHSFASKLEVLSKFMCKFDEDYIDESKTPLDGTDFCVSSFVPQDLAELKIEVVRGKPLQSIESSKFCSERIMRVTRELCILWRSKQACHTNGPQFDDSLAAPVLALHPGATVVKGESTLGLHPGCQALETMIRMLEEGEDEMTTLPIEGSVVVVGAPLLSRLQYGLFLAIASAFTQVLVYRRLEVGTSMPVVVLKELKSYKAAAEVVKVMHGLGWAAAGGGGLSRDILQVVGVSSLLHERPLMSLHHYNVHLCAYLAQALLSCITAQGEGE